MAPADPWGGRQYGVGWVPHLSRVAVLGLGEEWNSRVVLFVDFARGDGFARAGVRGKRETLDIEERAPSG